MKTIIIAALFAASIIAGEPDWGKIIDDQRHVNGHHHHNDDCPTSSVPEPGTVALVGLGLTGAIVWKSRRK
jgi:hypothetical protein